MRRPTRGETAALAAVGAVAVAEIALALVLHARFYATHLTRDDGAWRYYLVALALDGAHQHGMLPALGWALSSDQYVLQQSLAAALGPVLPTRLWVGPVLNAAWLLGMAMAVAALFLERTRSPRAAFLLSLPPLLHVTLLTSPERGLTNLHPDVVAYTLGTAIVCLALLSRGFERRGPTLLVAAAAALLLMGRGPALVVVLAVLLPLLAGAAASAAGRRNLALGAVVALVLGAPWLVEFGPRMVQYFLLWHGRSRGVIGHAGLQRVALIPWEYVSEMTGGHLASMLALLVLGWWAAEGRMAETSSDRRARWTFVWMAVAPLVLMLGLRSENINYAFPAPLGIYLAVLRPAGDAERWVFTSGGRARWSAAALALLAAVFAYRMVLLHPAASSEKDGAVRVAGAMAPRPGGPAITFTFHGRLSMVAFANLLRYDRGQNALMDEGHEPLPDERPKVLVHQALLWADADRAEIAARLATIARDLRADGEVVVLDPSAYHPYGKVVFFPQSWPLWEAVSQVLLAAPGFERVVSDVRVTDVERVTVLRPQPAPAPTAR